MRKGRCKHFNGTCEDKCQAGIAYSDVVPGYGEPGWGVRMPCFPERAKENGVQPFCPSYEDPSDDEIAAFKKEVADSINRMAKVLPLVAKVKDEHEGENWSGVVTCPVCNGKLGLSHSGFNGHVWGKCETDNCLAWME